MADQAIPDNSTGLMRLVGNKEINEAQKKEREDQLAQMKEEVTSLYSHLMKLWEAAKNAKWTIENRLSACIRAKKGKYDPADLSAIREFGGSEIFMMLTNVKTRAIESQIKDILLPAGEKPWGISPSPRPEMPREISDRVSEKMIAELQEIMGTLGPEVPITPQMIDLRLAELMDEARSEIKKIANKECENAEQTVEDLLVEGDFYEELADFIKDFSIYLTAFMRGPFLMKERKLVWKTRLDGSQYPDYEDKSVVKYKRVSPFDMYPAPAAKNLKDGYNFERMRIRPSELMAFRDTPGFDKKAIDATLLDHRQGALVNWLWTDQDRASIENRPQEMTDPTTVIEGLLFYGDIPARKLAEFGIKYSGNIADDVPVSAMICGRRVLMVRINKHPLQWKPYYYASFDPSSDSIWGNAPPELMEDCQRMCNNTARALANNVAIASGPQVEIFEDRIDAREDKRRLWPWKVWLTQSDPTGSGKPAMQFYQPELLANQLLEVFNFFYSQAGEQLGIPAYEHGVANQAGGAGKTAHGLAMLMTAASTIMKDAIGYIDRNIIKKVIFQTWLYAITTGQMEYKGDIFIVARASEYLIIAEQLQARRQEFLAFTNNPIDLAIIGIEGRSKVLRETVRSLKMDGDDIIPPDWELQARMGGMNMMQPPMIPGGEGGMPAGGPPPGAEISEPAVGGANPIGGAPPPVPLQQMANF